MRFLIASLAAVALFAESVVAAGSGTADVHCAGVVTTLAKLGRLSSVATSSQTGTITLAADESEITCSGLGWVRPVQVITGEFDTLDVTVTFNAVTVSQSSAFDVALVQNIGPKVRTAGFSPKTRLSSTNLTGTWSIEGPSTTENGSFDVPFDHIFPSSTAQRLSVTRSGSNPTEEKITGPIASFTTVVKISHVGPGEVFNGSVDGVPIKLHIHGVYTQLGYTGSLE